MLCEQCGNAFDAGQFGLACPYCEFHHEQPNTADCGDYGDYGNGGEGAGGLSGASSSAFAGLGFAAAGAAGQHRWGNLERGKPLVGQALQRLDAELEECHLQGTRVLTLIHGYGSTGSGGAIRAAVRERLAYLEHQHQVEAVVLGESFEGRSKRGRQLVRRLPFLRQHPDLNRSNPGITVVLLPGRPKVAAKASGAGERINHETQEPRAKDKAAPGKRAALQNQQWQQGEAAGREAEKRDLAARMLMAGKLSLEDIAEYAGLELDEVRALAARRGKGLEQFA